MSNNKELIKKRKNINNRQKRYYQKHREKILEKARIKSKIYYYKHKKKKLEYAKQKRQSKEYKEYMKEYSKNYYKLNKKTLSSQQKRRYEKNKDIINEKRRLDRLNNPEKYKLLKQKEYLKNKEKILKRTKKYYYSNIIICKKAKKRYRQSKRGKVVKKHLQLKRKTNMKNNYFNLSKKEIEIIYQRDKCCVYCGSDEKLSLDHIVPVSKGGATVYDNLVVACQSCNSSKNTKNVFEWCENKNIEIPMVIMDV